MTENAENSFKYRNFDQCTLVVSTDPREFSKPVKQSNLSEIHAKNGHKETKFWKSARWVPDGSSIIAANNDNRIFFYPWETQQTHLQPFSVIQEGESVYDVDVFPGMSILDASTCCFLSSTRDHPTHLWDVFTGQLRCTYSSFDHTDQIIAPNTVKFNLDGSRIFCGFNNLLHIFDTSIPGRQFKSIATTPKRKSREGQRGVISTIAFNPDKSGVYACGSYSSNIGLYDERSEGLLHLLRISGGVTQVSFSNDGQVCYASTRKEDDIICWDIRNTGDVISRFRRPGDTNQRLEFSLSPTEAWLASGDTQGDVSVFNLETNDVYKFHGHEDSVSSVDFHPTIPLLLSCSGSRRNMFEHEEMPIDNTLKIWEVPHDPPS
jgi:WD40 repeat protein